MLTLIAALSIAVTFCATTVHRTVTDRNGPQRPPSASAQCQFWADGYWVAEEGVKERTLRSWGCRFDGTQGGHDRWSRDRTSCGGQAFRLARGGVTGDALVAAMNRRGRCVQGDGGGWVPIERRR